MNEHVDELLALYALGGLEAEELQQVEAHLPGCAACRAAAEQERLLVEAIAGTAQPQAPDPRVRARLLKRAGVAEKAKAAPRAQPANWLSLPRWVVAGLSLVLAVLAGWNVYLTRELGGLERQVRSGTRAVALMAAPSTQEIVLVGGDEAVATGQAFISGDLQDVVLVVQDLTPLPAGQVYQAWVVTDAGATSAGFVDVSAGGWGMKWLEVPFVSEGWVCLSIEPAGGSVEPSDVVLWGGN